MQLWNLERFRRSGNQIVKDSLSWVKTVFGKKGILLSGWGYESTILNDYWPAKKQKAKKSDKQGLHQSQKQFN